MNRKTLFPILVVVFLVFLHVASAGAAKGARYALAFAWETSPQRALAYRERVAPLLGLATDHQLQIVGRDQAYGVVWNLDTSLEQARKAANQHNIKLQRAGLKPAQPTPVTSFHPLYHLGFTQASQPKGLQAEYERLRKGLGAQAGGQLVIEKRDVRTFAIVYRCWESRGSAQRRSQQFAALLRHKDKKPVLIPAVDRPVVTSASSAPFPEDGRKGEEGDDQPLTQQKGSKPLKTTLQQTLHSESTAGLNSKMETFLQEEVRKGKIHPPVRTGWAAFDLTTNNYLVGINLHRPFQAASMIKPFVALAFFDQVSKGKMTYSSQHRQMMEAMIQHSSNPATNWFLRQVGGPARCEALLKKDYSHLVGQIRIREYIPPDGRTYQNSVQPSGYIEFLRALWNYQLPGSKELLRVMALPGPDRLVYGAELPGGVEVYNKTGTTSLLCGDMGILVAKAKDGRKVPYAVVGIVERPSKAANYKQWMHTSGDAIRDFSSLVYEEMKRKHDLL